MPKRRKNERDIGKIALLSFLLFSVFISTSIVLSVYPQHILIDDKTVLDAKVGFKDNNTVNIRGNMVQYKAGDIVPIEGRDYVQITGRQVQLGSSSYTEGIRRLSASLTQNVLFEQEIGEFSMKNAAQMGIDGETIVMVPISQSVISVKTSDSSYNIELQQDTAYIRAGETMVRLSKSGSSIKIFIIGIRSYESIWLRVV